MRWLLEMDVFPDRAPLLAAAARRAGHLVTAWSDEWWSNSRFPPATDEPVLFHGSLGNAARINQARLWRPGAYCDVEALRSSRWYPAASRWLANERAVFTTVAKACSNPEQLRSALGDPKRIFVRPDSPLKPFSGRVLDWDALTPAALDFGFYYEEMDLPIVVAPEKQIRREWRFVVVQGEVVAGSEYDPHGRIALETPIDGAASSAAAEIAGLLSPPELVYILDLCEAAEGLRLLELNPFSGADLYHCNFDVVVERVARACWSAIAG